MGDWDRALTELERQTVAAAQRKAEVLYEGRLVRHRSCGVAMAETFGLPTAPYQALRRGGITGCGECGVVVSGRLVLGQWFGDPDPSGAVTEPLRAAATEYEARWRGRVDRGAAGDAVVCNALVAQFPDFAGPARARFCTGLAAAVAGLVAEVILRNGGELRIAPVPEDDRVTDSSRAP
ncbi:MAG: hypothetical protein R3F59_19430 [Myxococcota bacterium]